MEWIQSSMYGQEEITQNSSTKMASMDDTKLFWILHYPGPQKLDSQDLI